MLPFIVSGLRQGWAFAWRSLMAAEIYITILTGFGLGHLLHFGRELHAMDTVLGIMPPPPLRGPCKPSGMASGHISAPPGIKESQLYQGFQGEFQVVTARGFPLDSALL